MEKIGEVDQCEAETERPAIGMHLGRHQTLRSRPEADQNGLPGPQFGETIAAQSLHVHEDVGRAVASGEEAEAAQPVEPFDLGALQPAGRQDGDMGAWRRHLRRVHRGRFIHAENTKCLQAFGTLRDFTDHAGAFIGGLVAVAAQAGDVQQHIRHAVVGNDEAEPFGDIEPLDDTRQFYEIG